MSTVECPKCSGVGPCSICGGEGFVTAQEAVEYLESLVDNDPIRDKDQ